MQPTNDDLLNDLEVALTSAFPGKNERRDARAAVLARMEAGPPAPGAAAASLAEVERLRAELSAAKDYAERLKDTVDGLLQAAGYLHIDDMRPTPDAAAYQEQGDTPFDYLSRMKARDDEREIDAAVASLGRAGAPGAGGVGEGLRRLSEAATPGLWTLRDEIDGGPTPQKIMGRINDRGFCVARFDQNYGRPHAPRGQQQANAELTVAAVNDLRSRIAAEDPAAGTAPA